VGKSYTYRRCLEIVVTYLGAQPHGKQRMLLGSMPPAMALAGLPLVEGSSGTAGGGRDLPVVASMLNLLLASLMKRLPVAGGYITLPTTTPSTNTDTPFTPAHSPRVLRVHYSVLWTDQSHCNEL